MTGKSKKNEFHRPSCRLWKVSLGEYLRLASVSGALLPEGTLPLLVTGCGSLVSEI